ncbi:MAG: hypothetical protein KF784_08055 [Fimbriimonadaceae bacterium]|nr:hypothetical protein [Fimbriimonadaceae bacterium]
MLTCHLTKLETAVDQIKKAYPKMKPTDAALIASALVITGRHAIAHYEGENYYWPADYTKLTSAMVSHINSISDELEPPKKTKTAVEEEAVVVTVGLSPNYTAGEERLLDRKDLKATLSDVLQAGVEFVYSPTDVGWQWALERANWSTVTGTEVSKRIKIKASFTEGAVGVEMGATTKKRPASRKKNIPPPPPTQPEAEEEASGDSASEE